MSELYMTDEEIYVLYRDAIDHHKQLKILAELNGCEKSDIEAALKRYNKRLKELENREKEYHKIEAYRKKHGLR